ncbi:MAG: SagB/ThcOx family dehydrogenase [Acidobacteria bacterium]|nr:SagB/ThcOx family dehydrogenase [Acidobacteriota bacterium]
MTNREPDAAWEYHNRTKHSQWSVRNNPHFLDWANQPLPFKIYPELEPIPLPREAPQTGVAALSAITASVGGGASEVPDLKALSQLLYFSAGITRQRKYPGGEIYFRAAACTGALYEIELYLVCGDLPDLEAGVYHFGPADFALRKLRSGDWRGWLARASGNEPAVAQAPVTIVCSGTYWRNAWKYQSRTYRHFGWDNGTLLANLLAMSVAQGLAARLVTGFVDEDVNRLLGLDTQREVAFSMVAVGRAVEPARPPAEEPPPLDLEALPVSRREVDYPDMREMHAASSLRTPEEVAAWRSDSLPASPRAAALEDGDTPRPRAATPHVIVSLQPWSEEELPRDSIERVILRRGSTRQFARKSISLPQLSTLLEVATRGLNADFLSPSEQLNDLYLIVHAVDGLKPGAYFFDRARKGLEFLKEGDFRREAHVLGLEQDLPGDASLAVFFLADLERVLDRLGNRGYRATQLEAGISGGKLYLAAYALRLGATGLTFYDDDVVRFFSPHAEGKSAIFLTAIGHSAKRVASTE